MNIIEIIIVSIAISGMIVAAIGWYLGKRRSDQERELFHTMNKLNAIYINQLVERELAKREFQKPASERVEA